MNARPSCVFAAMGMLALSCAFHEAFGQGASSQGVVVLSKLSPPTYPQIARIARVQGDVEIALWIRQDGSVESAEVVSGPPLLREAALDSARQSQFECKQCAQLVTYTLTYHFDLAAGEPPKNCNQPEPAPPPVQMDSLKHQVTVSAWATWTCDPSGELIRVRSPKCLYLWRCGVREE